MKLPFIASFLVYLALTGQIINSFENFVNKKPTYVQGVFWDQFEFKDLVSQRVRWAGKTRHQRSSLLRFLAVLVGLTNLVVLLIFVLLVFFPENWEVLLLVPALKWITDAWLIFNSASYFKTRPKLFDFVTACVFYPIFGTWVFLAGLGGGYRWKDRDLAH